MKPLSYAYLAAQSSVSSRSDDVGFDADLGVGAVGIEGVRGRVLLSTPLTEPATIKHIPITKKAAAILKP